MNSENPYEAPASTLTVPEKAPLIPPEGPELAGRWARLGAAILDSLILVAVFFPIGWFSGYGPSEDETFLESVIWAFIGFGAFTGIQVWTLARTGQTIGKIPFGIRITGLSGEKMPVAKLLFLRYFVFNALTVVPMVGPWFGLEVLLIFNSDRRCGHDHLAGTIVVRA